MNAITRVALGAFLTLAACRGPQKQQIRGAELGESTAMGPSNPSAPLAVAPTPRPISSGAITGPGLPGGAGDPSPAATRDANNPSPTTLSPSDPQPNTDSGAVYAPGVIGGIAPTTTTGTTGAVTSPANSTGATTSGTASTAAPNGPGTGNAPISGAPSTGTSTTAQPAPVGPGTGNAPITPRR